MQHHVLLTDLTLKQTARRLHQRRYPEALFGAGAELNLKQERRLPTPGEKTSRHKRVYGRQSFRRSRLLDFSLFGISFIHAVLDERLAFTTREALSVSEILADVHLVPLTHFVTLLTTSFAEAVLHKVLAIVSLEALLVRHIVTGFDFVLLR
jgi:hypothetical protein